MKTLVPLIAVIVIAGGTVACSGAKTDDDKTAATNSQSDASGKSGAVKKACDILTLDEATKVLGAGAKGGSSNTDAPTESEHLTVSTCTYDNNDDSKTATILVRAAKSSKGIESNQRAFGSDKPADAQDVAGYGDKAFWSPQFGQLNVLKNNNWYIISNGPLNPAGNTLNEAKQLADLIISKL